MYRVIALHDPFALAEFNRGALKVVEEWNGFRVGQDAEPKDFTGPIEPAAIRLRGTVMAIGLDALDERGEPYVAIRVRFGNKVYDLSASFLSPVQHTE